MNVGIEMLNNVINGLSPCGENRQVKAGGIEGVSIFATIDDDVNTGVEPIMTLDGLLFNTGLMNCIGDAGKGDLVDDFSQVNDMDDILSCKYDYSICFTFIYKIWRRNLPTGLRIERKDVLTLKNSEDKKNNIKSPKFLSIF